MVKKYFSGRSNLDMFNKRYAINSKNMNNPNNVNSSAIFTNPLWEEIKGSQLSKPYIEHAK